jgi:Fe-S cluster biogenesis protein NfuA
MPERNVTVTPDSPEFQRRIEQIEGLVRRLDEADPDLRATAQELVQSLMDLHGAGLERILAIVGQTGEPATRIVDAFIRDDLVSSLLLLYSLHPHDLEKRVQRAVERVRPLLRKQGGRVEILSVEDGAVRARIDLEPGHGCGSAADTMRTTVEQAIYGAAPDLTALEIVEPTPASVVGFVPLAQLKGKRSANVTTGADCPAPAAS